MARSTASELPETQLCLVWKNEIFVVTCWVCLSGMAVGHGCWVWLLGMASHKDLIEVVPAVTSNYFIEVPLGRPSSGFRRWWESWKSLLTDEGFYDRILLYMIFLFISNKFFNIHASHSSPFMCVIWDFFWGAQVTFCIGDAALRKHKDANLDCHSRWSSNGHNRWSLVLKDGIFTWKMFWKHMVLMTWCHDDMIDIDLCWCWSWCCCV